VTPVLHPLTLEDRRWLEPVFLASFRAGEPLAAYSFPYHFIWQGVFRYEWLELEGHFCLMASNAEGSFLALPPLGPDPSGPAMVRAFEFLSNRNQTAAVTRIENAPEALATRSRERGYHVVPKGPDYMYRREDLVALKGDRYKSQRVAFNHCMKNSSPTIRIYGPEDSESCLGVFQAWRAGVPVGGATDLAQHMAADAEAAHRTGISHAADLGLVGRVVEVDGRVAGYTFGYPLFPSLARGTRCSSDCNGSWRGQGEGATFCVLLEIADRRVKGLSQFIFREFCRELEAYEFINTMDDSGLEGLRRAKLAYHPTRLVESYIISPP
jgi:hypothetical protein